VGFIRQGPNLRHRIITVLSRACNGQRYGFVSSAFLFRIRPGAGVHYVDRLQHDVCCWRSWRQKVKLGGNDTQQNTLICITHQVLNVSMRCVLLRGSAPDPFTALPRPLSCQLIWGQEMKWGRK